ncbi:hypothetical protein CFC21_029108 [Triticum aestivum]|uniref:Uncharacterized protein n=2 Tax=Triticum aestivum TaxID=4565 RepID=A0A9R1ESM3_WHEAT|nr:hypothetical protein CFC21_029107 [Triticum aestivum]KAF7015213.1 hypothetical protein CFC21_029108 [Triticum aestivum]
MSLQRYDLLMDAVTMLCLLPFGITERIWQKSPPRTIVMPPNGRSMLFTFLCLNISLRVLSSASKYILFAIGASSHSISDIFFSVSIKCEPCLMSQVDSSLRIRWMWNLECAVPSLCRSSTAITHDTTSVEQGYNSVKMVLTGGGLIAQLSRLQLRRVNRRMGHWRAGCRWRKTMSKCHLLDMRGDLKSDRTINN